jgi:tetratricopeptide (TPR) repeat protein
MIGIYGEGSDEDGDSQAAQEIFQGTVESTGATLGEPQTVTTVVNIQFDRGVTRALGKADPNRDHNAPEEIIRRNVTAAIQKAFEKPAAEVAERLDAAADPAAAVAALKKAKEDELLGFPPSKAILVALKKQDLSVATAEDRMFLRQAMLEVANQIGDIETVAREATALLDENPGAFDATHFAQLETAKAIGLARHGRTEAALRIWRRQLAADPPPDSLHRAWLWRNILKSLNLSDPAAKDAARKSADAFLEAGDKFQAISSLSFLVDAWMREAPEQAFTVMDEMLGIAGQEGLHNDELRAGILHNRGTRLLALGSHAAALEDGLAAVALRRGLTGVEHRLAGSLMLVCGALTGLGRMPEAEGYSEEADRLLDNDGKPHFAVADEISTLFETFDGTLAARIEAEARAGGQWEIICAVVTARATRDPSLTTEQRLELLEGLMADLAAHDLPGKMTVAPRRAVATILTDAGDNDRAAAWLRDLLDEAPWETGALASLANIYFKTENWRAAERLLASDIALRGERPGALFFLGKAQFRLGEMSAAVTNLQKSFSLAPDGSDMKEQARLLRDEALAAGGTILPDKPKPVVAPVSRTTFEAALADFAKMIAADQRKGFWRIEDKTRKWIQSPENYGRNLLHAYLKAAFKDQINLFRELDAGAGRLDVLVQLAGGLNIILELKMCGQPYSSSYAAEGEVQILHYMENRGVHLGYLIVFDARARDNGKPLLATRSADRFTVGEIFVDVRPDVVPPDAT